MARKVVIYVLVVASMILSSVFLFRCFPSWVVYSRLGFIFFSDLCLLVAMWLILLPRLLRSPEVVPPLPA